MNRFMRWFKRLPHAYDPGRIVPPPEGDRLFPTDGISYSQPPVVPFHIDRSDGAAVTRYLEQVRSSYSFQFDGNRTLRYDGQVVMPADDPLTEWDQVTRLSVLTDCHAAYHRNPIAKQAVDLTRRFVVGKGHTVTATNDAVHEVIEAFRDNVENYVHGYDRTFIQDLQVDGELMIRFFSENGRTIMAQIPPWWVKAINTEPGFMRRIKSYDLQYTQNNQHHQENVPADEILMVTINNHGYELRGRPDLFVILPWLRAYNEWLVDRARQNKWRGALLWVVKVASKIAGDVAAVRAVWRTPPTPGSVAVVPDNVDVAALTNSVGANDASEDGRQIKLQAAVGVGLPEYMLSDGENANLASATAQQLPALWKFTDGQELMKEQVWTPIYRRVIQAAVDSGDLTEEVEVQDAEGDPVLDDYGVPKMVEAVKAFEVGYYELQADDPKTLAEAVTMLQASRIMSTETARERVGVDHMTEERRLAREETAAADDALRNTEIPPGQAQPPPDEETEDEEAEAVADATT